MSTIPSPAILGYEQAKEFRPRPVWAPLAKTIAVIAILSGSFRAAEIVHLFHKRPLLASVSLSPPRWHASITTAPSSLPLYIKADQAVLLTISLRLSAAIAMALGGILVLCKVPAGRVLLLIGLAWLTFVSVQSLLDVLMNQRYMADAREFIEEQIASCSALVIYSILASIILTREQVFSR